MEGFGINHSPTDIAFMLPPSGEFPSFQYHLGVAYIQAYLAKNGITSRQVIPTRWSTLSECAEQLISTDAKIVGFTCYDKNYFLVRTFAALIKRKRPEIVVIAGGPTATFSDELLLNNVPDIDLCVRFEGEETTLELASRILEGSSPYNFENIAGISYRCGGGIVRNPDRRLFGCDGECDLDGFPSPYLEGILRGTEGTGILSARGCIHHCTYCNYSIMSKHTIRYHSIDRFIAELRYIQAALERRRLRHQLVPVSDDAFTLNLKRAKNICERIIDEGIRLRLSCQCRADNIDEELIDLLSQAGFRIIVIGVESGSPRILRNMRKVCNIESQFDKEYLHEKRFLSKVREVVSIAKRYNIKTEVSIILGLPGETYEDGMKTIEFIRSLDVDYYNHNYLVLFPGTEIFDIANNYGIRAKLSELILPYDIEYSYPVEKFQFEKNSTLQMKLQSVGEIILRSFAGGPDMFIGSGNGTAIALIESIDGDDLLRPFLWASNFLAVGGTIIIIGREAHSIENYSMALKDIYTSGLPTRECYYLRAKFDPGSRITYEIINKPVQGRLQQWNPQFPVINFSKFAEFIEKADMTSDQCWPICSLSERGDVDFLSELSKELAQDANGADSVICGVFLDGCRWGNNLCPALKLRRIFINRDQEILPCMNGHSLGSLGGDMRDIRNNAQRIYSELYEERKCGECAVEANCAKCLFPYPFSQQEYCELRRAKPDISGIVARSNRVNAFKSLAI